jgi:hypothetical protein
MHPVTRRLVLGLATAASVPPAQPGAWTRHNRVHAYVHVYET